MQRRVFARGVHVPSPICRRQPGIWTPTPSDAPVAFYFDGETTPRLRVPMRDLFTGQTFPFVSPVVGIGAGIHDESAWAPRSALRLRRR
jgi:hypothetical protein